MASSLVGAPVPLSEEETQWLIHFNHKRLSKGLKAKFLDPPIKDQAYGLFSFLPSANAKPNEKGEYGLLKLRGNFACPESSKLAARKLILETDQIFPIFEAPIGLAFPLTNDMLENSESEFFRGDISEEEYHEECKRRHESDIKKRALLNEMENSDVSDLRKCFNHIRVTIACAMNGIVNLKTFDNRTRELMDLLPTVGLDAEEGCLIKSCVEACQKEDEAAGLNTTHQFDKIRAKIGLLPKIQKDLASICKSIQELDPEVLEWAAI